MQNKNTETLEMNFAPVVIGEYEEETNDNALLPNRHPQGELFLCDIADAVLKDDMASMEHPFYTLSKKPDTKEKTYRNGDKWFQVVPSSKGRPTIYDKDLLIYCISQLMAAENAGKPTSNKIRIISKDFLIFTNRATGGRNYKLLRDMIDRIAGTRFWTNIDIDESEEEITNFGLVEEASLIKSKKTGQIVAIEITLSKWVTNIINDKRVLTLHPNYFRLKKPMERRFYELGRKHCGYQPEWRVNDETLWTKCGGNGTLSDFRYKAKDIIKTNALPDYFLEYDPENYQIVYKPRSSIAKLQADMDGGACTYILDTDAHDRARKVASGWCPQLLEKEWRRSWVKKGKEKLHDPTAAYVGFCKAWFEIRGRP